MNETCHQQRLIGSVIKRRRAAFDPWVRVMLFTLIKRIAICMHSIPTNGFWFNPQLTNWSLLSKSWKKDFSIYISRETVWSMMMPSPTASHSSQKLASLYFSSGGKLNFDSDRDNARPKSAHRFQFGNGRIAFRYASQKTEKLSQARRSAKTVQPWG